MGLRARALVAVRIRNGSRRSGFALGAIARPQPGRDRGRRAATGARPDRPALEITTAVDALVAVVALGVLMCIHNPTGQAAGRPLTPTEWVAVTLGIGIVGGAFFHLFLGEERHIDRIFISLAGAIILTSGAASYLGVSPLLPAMIVGMMLVNTSAARSEIQRTLLSAERPFTSCCSSWRAHMQKGVTLLSLALF